MNIINAKKLQHKITVYDKNGEVSGEEMAIKDVTLEISQGDFIAILGHNGSGKSTFAKHLNGILMPSGGELYVGGINTTNEEKIWDIRQSVGLVFQNPDNQIVGTIVEEDVGFGPENLGVETSQIWKRVDKALKDVDMLKYRNCSPHRLSGGQKQRVAIAGILAMKPKCIVLDEATAMLDPVGRREVLDTVWELNKKEGVTIILITHYMEEVVKADKVFVMDEGEIKLSGTPKEVFSQVDKMREYRLDVPQATEIAYKLQHEGIDIRKDILTMDELAKEIIKIRKRG